MKIVGMDLGTSNTYLYLGTLNNDQADTAVYLPRPLVIEPQSDRHGSIATVVLYENDLPIAFGNIAESEFNVHGDYGGKRFLATQFKPELAKNDSPAQRWVRDFLAELKKQLPQDFFAEDVKVYVGIPSLAREDFCINLNRAFQDAGWPKPEFVRESDAAVVSCLEAGTLSIDDMENKCLILDFGGGTCDYTAIEGLDVLQNGGDVLYGGRLFDDLIFQRFLKADKIFADAIFSSPVYWYVHWVECRRQKEDFSDFLNDLYAKNSESGEVLCHLRLHWLDNSGERRESYLTYDREEFFTDAENFQASRDLLNILEQYKQRGGLSHNARELMEGRQIGLISWLRTILESVDKKSSVRKIVLTGGSSRWHFTGDLCHRIFPAADCLHSRRGYEDIAFGLALFPVLLKSRERARELLRKNLPEFTRKAILKANEIIETQTVDIAYLCAEHIIERDILPCLESASNVTVLELEQKIRENILDDHALLDIVRNKSEILNKRIQEDLGREFRDWLRENGVPLTPDFKFPGKAIGNDFFLRASECLSNMDIVKLTRLVITAILPLLLGGAAAHFLAPIGEPISIGVGIGLTGTLAWLAAKTAPQFLENRKIPSFFLTEKSRKKIIEKNRSFIRKELEKEFARAQTGVAQDVEKRLTAALDGMVNSLNILNQIKTSRA